MTKRCLKSIQELYVIVICLFVTGNSSLSAEHPQWRDPNGSPSRKDAASNLPLRGALLGKLAVDDPSIDLDGRLEVAVMVQYQGVRILPRRIFFPNYPSSSTRYKPYPFQLVLYDRNRKCLNEDLLRDDFPRAGLVKFPEEPRVEPADWRWLQASDLGGICFNIKLDETITSKPGIYFLQAIFNSHINRTKPEDLSTLGTAKAWALDDKDRDIFRSNTVKLVISEHVVDSGKR